ncbi:MAG: aspartate--ammonia ligase [Lachnospiraceae bacterium]|nr:aspartate--ammonia ligase [Lachnospiraceae bacterium]
MALYLPEGYDAHMDVRTTQAAIKFIRDLFTREFGKRLNLERVSAPLFVDKSTGLNDNLNGVERPVSFDMKSLPGVTYEVVQSLAKWKRTALKTYGFGPDEGLYTNMNAIRRDEDLDNLHSAYVDQWDWEMAIRKEDRTEKKLKEVVRKIFRVIKHMEHEVWYRYPDASYRLPDKITFITTKELEERYPEMTRKERENAAAKEYGCIFLQKIGWPLADGKPHDGRAPDYDDWNLNGDIIFWFEPLQCALEISSMGIRVDEEAMKVQLEASKCLDRANLPYHQDILNCELPYSIGGGIGQSRLCMLLLGRVHIGEVQSSVWPEDQRKECAEHNVVLL